MVRHSDPVRARYLEHHDNARNRGIPFKLTFEQWCAIWEASGKWEQRGNRSEQYCMSRPGDRGAYELGNVVICTNRDNRAERCRNYKLYGEDNPAFGKDYWAAASRKEKKRRGASISKRLKGKKKSLLHRARMAKTATGRRRVIRNGNPTWSHPGDKDYPG